jgi:DinB superfamily
LTVTARDEAVRRWASFPARLADAARAAVDRPVPAGEWRPAEVVRHLIAVEREVWWVRFGSIVTDDEPRWGWMEPGLEPGLEGATLDDVLSRFDAARAHSVGILDGFAETHWARTGVHATYGRLDAEALLGIVSRHDQEHLDSLA